MHPRFAELSAGGSDARRALRHLWRRNVGRRAGTAFQRARSAEQVRVPRTCRGLPEAFAEVDIFGYPLAPDTSATSEKAIQEAMWVGIPPVVLSGSGAVGLVEHERTGLVCDHEDDYPRAIERLAEDSRLRRRLGETARNFAHEHFDPARNSAQAPRRLRGHRGVTSSSACSAARQERACGQPVRAQPRRPRGAIRDESRSRARRTRARPHRSTPSSRPKLQSPAPLRCSPEAKAASSITGTPILMTRTCVSGRASSPGMPETRRRRRRSSPRRRELGVAPCF